MSKPYGAVTEFGVSFGVMDVARKFEGGTGEVACRAEVAGAADTGDWVELRCIKAYTNGDIVVVDADNNKYTMPLRDVAYNAEQGSVRVKDSHRCVGKILRCLVSDTGEKLTVSRGSCQAATNEYIRSEWKPGDIVEAVVIGYSKFGVICDIGNGLVALMTEKRISYSHRDGRAKELPIGTVIKAVYEKCDSRRIYLTMQELLGSWDECIEGITAGESMLGKVCFVDKDSGTALVELRPNIRGVADVTTELSDRLTVGNQVVVFIRKVDYVRKKVKLDVLCEAAAGSETEPMAEYYTLRTLNNADDGQFALSESRKHVKGVLGHMSEFVYMAETKADGTVHVVKSVFDAQPAENTADVETAADTDAEVETGNGADDTGGGAVGDSTEPVGQAAE